VFSKELGGPGATRVDHPSRTDRGDGRRGGQPLRRSRLIRYPDAPRNRSEGGEPPKGRGFGTGFSHTVEFSRNVARLLFSDSPAVPASRRRQSGGTVPRASQDRHRLPTCPVSVLLVEHRRHVATVRQKRRPAPDPSGRQDGHRTAVGSTPVAFGDLLSSGAGAGGVVPERSSVVKNFPAYSSAKVAPCSTACQLVASFPDANQHNGSRAVAVPTGPGPLGADMGYNGPGGRPIPGCRGQAPGGGPGCGGPR
jgi:hypothetical protein